MLLVSSRHLAIPSLRGPRGGGGSGGVLVLLGGHCGLVGLLARYLLLRLVVAVRDQAVQEAVGPALWVAFLFGFFDVFVQVAG